MEREPEHFQRVYRAAQEFMAQDDTPGWLVYDYRESNPIFRQVIQPSGHVTRPCYFYLPVEGTPTLLTHHVDAGKFADSRVRSEIDVFMSADGPRPSSQVQREVALMG